VATCGRDKTVWVWERSDDSEGDEVDFECVAVLSGHSGDVKTIIFASDGVLLSGGYDGTVRAWVAGEADEAEGGAGEEWYGAWTSSVRDRDGTNDGDDGTVWALCGTAGGSRLVAGTGNGSVLIWRRTDSFEPEWKSDGSIETDFEFITDENKKGQRRRQRPVYSVDIGTAKGGHGRLVTGGGSGISIFREAPAVGCYKNPSNRQRFVREAHLVPEDCHGPGHDVNCVRWHPMYGNIMVSGGDDGTVKVWEFDPS